MDWIVFRQLRNRFTFLVKKAKSEYYISNTTSNLNDPKKFWKVIKNTFGTETKNELPACIVTDSQTLTDKSAILNCFNEHFISSGSLFESLHSDPGQNVDSSPPPSHPVAQPFNFTFIEAIEVHKALQHLDPHKSAGPDKLPPHFLKLAADFIAAPLTYLFN